MFPDWNLRETFDRVKTAGCKALELRVRPDAPTGTGPWGGHRTAVSPDNISDRAAEIVAESGRTGVRVAALATKVTYDNPEELDRIIDGALAIDRSHPPMIRIGAPPYDRDAPYLPQFEAGRSGIAACVARAGARGVKLLWEIHRGVIAMSAPRARALVDGNPPASIGCIYDIPNMIEVAYEDPAQSLELLGPYLAHVHIGSQRPVVAGKRPDGSLIWRWDHCRLHEGPADIAGAVRGLAAANYSGCLSLEDFSPGEDGEKLQQGMAFLARALADAEAG